MAVAATNLTTEAGNAQQTSYTTASVSPGSNRLELLWVYSIASSLPNIPSITSNGLTWVQVDTQVDSDNLRRLTLFRAMGTPVSGTGTIDFSAQTQQGACWSYVEYTGMDTSGTNGSGAIVQSAKAASAGNAINLTVTLAAFSSSTNATAGGFGIPLNTASKPAVGSGFTATGQANQASTNTAIGSEFNAANATTVDMTATPASIPWTGIAVEVASDSALSKAISDSMSISESLSHYSDQLDSMESSNVALVDNVTKSDTLTITENVAVLITGFINKSDTLTITENVGATKAYSVICSDSSTISESIGRRSDANLAVTDSSTITESVTIAPPLIQVNVSDSSTISESIITTDTELEIVSDSSTISESLSVKLTPLIQVATNTSTASSVTATLGSTPIEGNLMVALVYANKDQGVVSMSGWRLAVQSNFNTAISASIFYKAAGVSESTSVTALATSATVMDIHAYEYNFVGTTLDQISTTSDTGVNVTQRSSGTTGTTKTPIELVMAAVGTGADQGDALHWTNSFSGRAYTPHLAGAEFTTSATGTYSSTASWTSGAHAVGLIASFNNALEISVSDTLTISESRKLLNEQHISVEDDMTIEELNLMELEGLFTSDTITSDEFVAVDLQIDVNQNESLVTTELVAVQYDVVDIDETVTDSSTISESLGHYSDQMEIMEYVNLEFVTQVATSVFDLTSISESLNHYSDQLDMMENVQLQIVTVIEDIDVGIGDTLDTTENIVLNLSLSINVSDSSTISENKAVIRGNTWEIAITDSRILDESGNFILDEDGNFIQDETPMDLLTTTESVQAFVYTDKTINVSDSSTISEAMGISAPPLPTNVSILESMVISESFAVALSIKLVTVSDSSTISETISVQIQPPSTFTVSILENSAISESLAVSQLTEFISVSDTSTISEIISVVISSGNIVSFDAITTSENISINIDPKKISVSDSSTIGESLLIQETSVAASSISTFDNSVINESVTVVIDPKRAILSDTLTINEALLITLSAPADLNILTFDSLATSENILGAPTPLRINVSELSTTTELLTMQGPTIANVSDTMTITESVKVKTKPPKAFPIHIDFDLPDDISIDFTLAKDINLTFQIPNDINLTFVIPDDINLTVIAEDQD